MACLRRADRRRAGGSTGPRRPAWHRSGPLVPRPRVFGESKQTKRELERLVREEVLAKAAFWLEPEAFDLTVRAGVVHIAGRVERRSLAETIVAVTRDLGGVVGVESGLTWEIDDVEGSGPSADPDVLMTLRPH